MQPRLRFNDLILLRHLGHSILRFVQVSPVPIIRNLLRMLAQHGLMSQVTVMFRLYLLHLISFHQRIERSHNVIQNLFTFHELDIATSGAFLG